MLGNFSIKVRVFASRYASRLLNDYSSLRVSKLSTQLSSGTILGLLISLLESIVNFTYYWFFFSWVVGGKGWVLNTIQSEKIRFNKFIIFTLLKSLWICSFKVCGEKVQICWIKGFWYNDLFWSVIFSYLWKNNLIAFSNCQVTERY